MNTLNPWTYSFQDADRLHYEHGSYEIYFAIARKFVEHVYSSRVAADDMSMNFDSSEFWKVVHKCYKENLYGDIIYVYSRFSMLNKWEQPSPSLLEDRVKCMAKLKDLLDQTGSCFCEKKHVTVETSLGVIRLKPAFYSPTKFFDVHLPNIIRNNTDKFWCKPLS